MEWLWACVRANERAIERAHQRVCINFYINKYLHGIQDIHAHTVDPTYTETYEWWWWGLPDMCMCMCVLRMWKWVNEKRKTQICWSINDDIKKALKMKRWRRVRRMRKNVTSPLINIMGVSFHLIISTPHHTCTHFLFNSFPLFNGRAHFSTTCLF